MASRRPHKPEIEGSIPSSATSMVKSKAKYPRRQRKRRNKLVPALSSYVIVPGVRKRKKR